MGGGGRARRSGGRALVLEAVRRHGAALEFAADALRADRCGWNDWTDGRTNG